MVRSKGVRTEGNACLDGYSEQEWADYVLGGLYAGSRAAMTRHLGACAACAGALEEWRLLLAAEPIMGDVRQEYGLSTAAEAGPGAIYPGERVRRSLARAVARRSWRTKLLRNPVRYGLAAAVCVMLVFAAWMRAAVEPAEPVDSFVSSQVPDAVTVVQAQDTLHYRVMPAAGGQSGGYMWLSGDVSEALLLLEGLPFLEQEDYQAWAVAGERQESLGLLKLTGSRGHLFVRSPLLRGAETISLSSEPKGGSASPTSEQTVLVLMGQVR
jgi:anti-sigma-K factor RskA